jgi:hypothetical protein
VADAMQAEREELCTNCHGQSPTVDQMVKQLGETGDPSGACSVCNNTHVMPSRLSESMRRAVTDDAIRTKSADPEAAVFLPVVLLAPELNDFFRPFLVARGAGRATVVYALIDGQVVKVEISVLKPPVPEGG